jgi:hypothetical protein
VIDTSPSGLRITSLGELRLAPWADEEGHVLARIGEAGTEIAADSAGADYRYSHGSLLQ